jgi:hypothetical protein
MIRGLIDKCQNSRVKLEITISGENDAVAFLLFITFFMD